jgi:hypothetical protein
MIHFFLWLVNLLAATRNFGQRGKAEDFGIRPATETTALYQSICAPLQRDT